LVGYKILVEIFASCAVFNNTHTTKYFHYDPLHYSRGFKKIYFTIMSTNKAYTDTPNTSPDIMLLVVIYLHLHLLKEMRSAILKCWHSIPGSTTHICKTTLQNERELDGTCLLPAKPPSATAQVLPRRKIPAQSSWWDGETGTDCHNA